MKEQVVAKIYAKSITELGEKKRLDVCEELTRLQLCINESNHLENLLFLEVFTVEEKKAVVEELCKRLQLSSIVAGFLSYLVEQRRIGLFPLIYRDVVVFDDAKRGFMKGVIEGHDEEVDPSIQKRLEEFLKAKVGKNIELVYEKNPEITAGHRVTVGDLQLDATLENQLNKFKQDIISSRNIRG